MEIYLLHELARLGLMNVCIQVLHICGKSRMH